jgi:hypothetical protein
MHDARTQLSPAGDRNADACPDHLQQTLQTLVDHRAALRGMTTARIADRIGQLAERWLSPGHPRFTETVRATAAHTGYSEAMVEWSLRELLRRMSPASLTALVEAELGSREPFQAPRSAAALPCDRGAHPPALIFQVLAGTVPPVAIESIVLALLARGPILLKTSSSEPVVARAFLQELREIDPGLARHVSVMTWTGGDARFDAPAARAASIVSVYGGNDAVNAILARCQFPTRFYGYGHRISFGVLGPTADTVGPAFLSRIVEDIALDAAAYDQRGCMSPHVLFVSRHTPWTADDVGRAIASKGFPAVEARLPRGTLSTGTLAQIQQARGTAEFTAKVYESPTALTIVHDETAFHASPGGRTLHVVPYDRPRDLIAAIQPFADAISVVGLHHQTPGRNDLIAALGHLGARRITRLGRMQRPLWLRDHDGRPRIGDWVDWTNVEPLY